jgi:SOS-response transcriptional repressor LexA
MVFRRNKTKELEQEIAYLKGKLDALTQLKSQEPQKPITTQTTTPEQELEEPPTIAKAKRKLDKLSWALIEKRIQALEKRLTSPIMEQAQENLTPDQTTLDNIDGNNVDLKTLLSNPMIRIAINSFLRKYGTSIDDLASDPSKLITLLENLTAELKAKKQEAENKGETFNPYDPSLFMKR